MLSLQCLSYSEVQRFEENAASFVAYDALGTSVSDTFKGMRLFVADNVDNIVSVNGKGTFLGMGMIVAITPANVHHRIQRHGISELNITVKNSGDITQYCFAKSRALQCEVSRTEGSKWYHPRYQHIVGEIFPLPTFSTKLAGNDTPPTQGM